MNIALVTRFYPPDTGGGGIAAYARYLAVGLLNAGHRVRVVSRMVPKSRARQSVNGIEVFRIQVPEVPFRYHRLPIVGRYIRFINDLLYAGAVRNTLLALSVEANLDLVEYADIDAEGLFHPYEVGAAVVKLHTPHFVLKRFYTKQETPYDTSSVSWLEKKFIRNANGLSSPSSYLAKAVSNEYQLAADLIRYVPNPIDTDFFSPNGEAQTPNQTVLYVGRLEPRKGAMTFAQAIPRIAKYCPQALFIFLGADRHSPNGSSQKAELEAYLTNQGVMNQVRFQGHAPPEIFREFYRQATVFVMPSIFENSPYTLLEAMACGNAVVVNKAYGMKEMITDGESGLFFESEDADDLAEKTIRLLENQELRKRLGHAARAVVLQNHSLDVGTEKTLAFYRSVLSKS